MARTDAWIDLSRLCQVPTLAVRGVAAAELGTPHLPISNLSRFPSPVIGPCPSWVPVFECRLRVGRPLHAGTHAGEAAVDEVQKNGPHRVAVTPLPLPALRLSVGDGPGRHDRRRGEMGQSRPDANGRRLLQSISRGRSPARHAFPARGPGGAGLCSTVRQNRELPPASFANGCSFSTSSCAKPAQRLHRRLAGRPPRERGPCEFAAFVLAVEK